MRRFNVLLEASTHSEETVVRTDTAINYLKLSKVYTFENNNNMPYSEHDDFLPNRAKIQRMIKATLSEGTRTEI